MDHYELLNHLGDGSQAEVYHAKDLRDGAEVVIKFPLARNLDHPVLAARWRREVAITEGLHHRRIVCRCDGGERHSEPYVVLEYAGSGTLRSWVSTPDDPLPIGQAVAWGCQLAEALVFLHGEGILHHDLKPENILVASDLTIKLGDFGSAIAARNGKRHLLSLPVPPEGTAWYLSPEQITGKSSDERSDIYSWGIVLYELLAGQVPFTGGDPSAAMTAHLREHPVPLRDLRPDVAPALELVVMTAMRRHPDHRYAHARDLLADLDRLGPFAPAITDPTDGGLTAGGTTFDTPEDPITAPVGGAEWAALVRLAVVVMVGFLALCTLAVVLTIVLR